MDIRPIDANALVKDIEEYQKSMVFHSHGERMHFDDMIDFAVDHLEEAPTLSFNTLRDEIYEDAVAHGLFEDFDKITDPVRKRRALAMRIMEEAAEMYAAADNPEHYAEEAADVTIMTGDVCGYLDIDWDAAIRRKMEINKTRPWKHGKE